MKLKNTIAFLVTIIITLVCLIPCAIFIIGDRPSQIIATYDDAVYPGQVGYISAVVENKSGKVISDYEMTFTSSNPDIINFSDEHEGDYVVNQSATDGDFSQITIQCEKIRKDFIVSVDSGIQRIINVSLDNDEQTLNYGETYLLNLQTYPKNYYRGDFAIQTYDMNGNLVDGYIEIDDDNFLIKTIGVGKIILKLTSVKYPDANFSLPLTIEFDDDVLNRNIKDMSKDEIQQTTNIDLLIDSDRYQLDALNIFPNLSTITINDDSYIDFSIEENFNFDILVKKTLFDTYENNLTSNIQKRVYPISEKNKVIIYYVDTILETTYYIDETDDYSTLSHNILGYDFIDWHDENGTVYTSLNNLPNHYRLYGTYQAKQYTITFVDQKYGEDIEPMTISYGSVINLS